jgi:hypothetical protein
MLASVTPLTERTGHACGTSHLLNRTPRERLEHVNRIAATAVHVLVILLKTPKATNYERSSTLVTSAGFVLDHWDAEATEIAAEFECLEAPF